MKYIKAIIAVIMLTLLDQLTKFLAVTHLKDSPPIPVIKDVFELRYLENRGSAFGMLQDKRIFFIIVTIIIVAAFIWIFIKTPHTRRILPINILCVFIVSGALGNFIDRLFNGYVVDFFYFKLIDFPIFNVADIYVTLAAAALIILGLFYYKEEDFDMILKKKSKSNGTVPNEDQNYGK